MLTIGIIKEGKTPPDTRVPLSPQQCVELQNQFNVSVKVQKSAARCFTDEEYRNAGLDVVDDVSDCSILLGVKEVPIDMLTPNKDYFFFSHTIKKQPYNKGLLQAILQKNIRLHDWECLTKEGKRVIAFGRWAGIVGAHNGIMAFGKRDNQFELPAMNGLKDFAEAKAIYKKTDLPAFKVVLTGRGRVSTGSVEVLEALGIKAVKPQDFLTQDFDYPVYTQLGVEHMYTNGEAFNRDHYFNNFKLYSSAFKAYTEVADIMINGIYWEAGIPAFFTADAMAENSFNIKTIADITCDIAPVASIPSTLRPSTIADPVFGYDPKTKAEIEPYQAQSIDMMAVDNLPNELPRDASEDFGAQFLKFVAPELNNSDSEMLFNARITKKGALNEPFEYLTDYVA